MFSRATSSDIKKILLFIPLATGAIQASAQDILPIEPVFFHRDAHKKLILINAPLARINAAIDTLKIISSGDKQYKLLQPVTSVSTQVAYQAQAEDSVYTVYFTQVPIVHITTKHQIVDAPSVYANFALTDTTGTLAQSAMGIEIRGGSSQSFPKKSYELSLWADTAGVGSQDIQLLGLRTDNKWNLQAMYNDPLRLRMKLANELWMSMNQVYYKAQEPAAKSGIDMAYAEVFLNNQYQGIYTLTERVDRKQLKIKKYTTKIMGELYKGIDNSKGAITFSHVPEFDNFSTTWGGFEYKEPSEETNWTALHDFVDFVVNSPDTEFYSKYKSKFNLANAVDYFIFLNLMRATDNTGKNLYIAKYKPNEPYYYVPWDLDGVLGNDWQGLNVNITDGLLTNGFYDRLLKDADFHAALASRWSALRTSVITKENIGGKLKQTSDYLLTNNVYEREHLAWSAYRYDPAQLTYPTQWLTNRLLYLDTVVKPANALATSKATSTTLLQLYPNPATGAVHVAFGATPYQLSIQSLTGETLLQKMMPSGASEFDVSTLPKGVYVARVKNETATVVQKLLVR